MCVAKHKVIFKPAMYCKTERRLTPLWQQFHMENYNLEVESFYFAFDIYESIIDLGS